MSPIEAGRAPAAGPFALAAPEAWAVRAMFIAALFLSAWLVFAVQPLFTKMILPVLGGSPAVWSVAMVFFQGLLLAGYLYAHALTRFLSPMGAAAAHLCVLALAWLTLPVAVSTQAPPETGQAIWLLSVFAMALGAPFFALSANGPLLQAWFARTRDPRAHDPYFLYGASNIGSFFALLSYPLVFEPLLGLKAQSQLWSAGFFTLGAMIAVCAFFTLRHIALAGASVGGAAAQGAVRRDAGSSIAPVGAVTVSRFAVWAVLGFVPSGLLVSVTAYISTDIAAAPLLWVAPLALFLLTFVIAFRDRPAPFEDKLGPAQIWLTAFVFFSMVVTILPLGLNLLLHLLAFFVNAIVCHRTLYKLRPASRDLTLFYVAMSLGGVLGGLFAALAGPALFSTVLEYPLLMVAAVFCGAGFVDRLRQATPGALALPALVCAVVLASVLLPAEANFPIAAAALGVCMIAWWRISERVALFAASACLLLALQPIVTGSETHRSFFGVHKVIELNDGALRAFIHGTTMHGVVRVRTPEGAPIEGRPQPTAYYAFEGPIGEAISSVRAARGGLDHMLAIGQGVGTLACHLQAGERITFFEIDPLVTKIADDPAKFPFMRACAPDARVVIGDARLTIAKEPDPAPIVVVDAFSSDAIPVHLLTKEAFGLYLDRLTPDGVIVFHITNRSMELSQIVARVAAEHGLTVWRRIDIVGGGIGPDLRASSVAVAIARHGDHIGAIAASPDWVKLTPNMADRVWTDDYSTILPAIAAKLFPR